MLAQAIYNLISATPAITNQLATWDFGAGLVPALFTLDPIPTNCRHPVISIIETGGPRWGSFECSGGYFSASVRVYDDKLRSRKRARDIAQLLWELLDLANLVIPGYDDVGTYADMPQELTDPDGFPGFLIPVTMRLIKS